MPAKPSDTNPKYWREYSNIQQVKHDLIRHYLGGWYAKLGTHHRAFCTSTLMLAEGSTLLVTLARHS